MLGIIRINWTVLVTKICNKLLPTAVNLKKWYWQSHDSCTLCKQKETMEHLIQCTDPSQNAWRIQYISELRWKFGDTNTTESLATYIFTMITNRMDTGMVIAEKFPLMYSKAIYSQYAIGWDNFFCGKISQEWLLLYNVSRTIRDDTQRYSAQYIWGVNIIKKTLRQMIKLWDIRNTQVHGTTDRKR